LGVMALRSHLPTRTRVWRIRDYPRDALQKDHFELSDIPVPPLKDGEILVRGDYISVDPYMRLLLIDAKKMTPARGDPMSGPQVGTVVASRSDKVAVGTEVGFVGPWAEYNVRDANHVRPLLPGVDPQATLSVVGLAGLTALFGLRDVAKLRPGEKILVTSGGGGVGYLVCKIAQLMGAEPVALVGAQEKIDFLHEIGVKNVISYRSRDAGEQLKRIAPNGYDVLWDSIGGKAIAPFRCRVAQFGRIVQCGAVSTYNEKDAMEPAWESQIVWHRWTVLGFIVWDFKEHFDEGLNQLAEWYRSHSLPSRVSLSHGFEQLPSALMGLFAGTNVGKSLVALHGPPPSPRAGGGRGEAERP